MQSIINDVADVCQSHIEAAGHDLIIHLPSKPIYVEADLVRIEQVVSNLLNNASKYTPEGGCIKVIVEEDGKQASIRVVDTGIGIEREMLPRSSICFLR